MSTQTEQTTIRSGSAVGTTLFTVAILRSASMGRTEAAVIATALVVFGHRCRAHLTARAMSKAGVVISNRPPRCLASVS